MTRREIAAVDDDVDWAWRIRTGVLALIGLVLLVVVVGLLAWVFLAEVAPWLGRILGIGGDPN